MFIDVTHVLEVQAETFLLTHKTIHTKLKKVKFKRGGVKHTDFHLI